MQLILIHGLGQTSSSWDGTLNGFAARTTISCPDLSAILRDKEVTYPNLYGAFSEYCAAFSQPLDLCGLSLGGILALHYTAEHPENVNSLVLIGAQYTMPKALLTVQTMMFRVLPNSMFREMGFRKEALIALSRSMMHLDFSRDLPEIPCPVLVVCGEKDRANKKAALGLAANCPHAEIQVIEGTGHEVNTESPERLAEVLNRFYRSIHDAGFQDA